MAYTFCCKNNMKTTLAIISVLALVCVGIVAQEDPFDGSKVIEAIERESKQAADAAILPLRTKYVEALEKSKTERSNQGDLDGALPYHREIQRIQTNAEIKADNSIKDPSDLIRLRGIFEKERGRLLNEVARDRSKKLKALVDSLTRTGNLASALKVQKLLDVDHFEPEKNPEFIGRTYAKPSNRAPYPGREVFTFLEAGKVKRADGQLAGWDRLGDRKIRVWTGENKSNPMTWTFDKAFKHADVYSPYHKTTVKAVIDEKQ
jgi:hypothetical protein